MINFQFYFLSYWSLCHGNLIISDCTACAYSQPQMGGWVFPVYNQTKELLKLIMKGVPREPLEYMLSCHIHSSKWVPQLWILSHTFGVRTILAALVHLGNLSPAAIAAAGSHPKMPFVPIFALYLLCCHWCDCCSVFMDNFWKTVAVVYFFIVWEDVKIWSNS